MSRIILVTGALAGIGRATAFAFARRGDRIAVSGRREDAGGALEAELRDLGADAVFLKADVRRDEDVRRLVDTVVERFGGLDVAVNNAGTEGTPGAVTDQTAESINATFDTNIVGTILSTKHEFRVMREAGRGSIVNVSSTYGHEGAAGASIYAASKHAVEGFTKSVALEGAALGIRVNAVAPGPTDTGMLDRFTGTSQIKTALAGTVPMGRIGRPEEVAAAILFIASEEASYITGQILTADGGKTAG